MGFWDGVNKLFGRSQLLDLVIQNNSNQAIYPDTKAAYFTDTYSSNPDVYSVIKKITDPASRIPVTQVDKKTLKEKPGRAIKLLNNPNPFHSQTEFVNQALTTYEIYGECFVVSEKPEFGLNAGKPVRLDNLPPQWVELQIGTFFEPITGYTLMLGANELRYSYADVMHWKQLNPSFELNGQHLRGMSPLKPLLKAVCASSSGYDSMVSMFQQMGAYGMLTILGVKEDDGKYSSKIVTQEQLSKMESSFRQKMQKAKGSVFATNKSVEWTPFGLSAVDMNILNSIVFSGGALYDAYGVPDILKAGSQSKTYLNFGEAQKSLWNNTIIPTTEGFYSKLSNWLMPLLGEEDTIFLPDFDNVAALQADKKEQVAWMIQAGFTYNMIWEALGYEPLPIDNMNIPLISAGLTRIDEIGMMPDAGLVESALKEYKDYRK